jgi:uncharacterized protein (TIGR04255 family)
VTSNCAEAFVEPNQAQVAVFRKSCTFQQRFSGDRVFENERITFDDPPVKEVALGRIFLFRPDFLVPYFGAYWERIKARYPKTEIAESIFEPTDMAASFSPRVFFLTDDSRSLVQIQQNRFHYNWRQTDDPVEYVRFPAIQKECLAAWSEFEQFVREMTGRALQPLNAELTYTNVVEAKSGETAADLAEVALHDSVWSKHERFLTRPKAFSSTCAFALPDQKNALQVTVTAVHRVESATEKIEALKIDLTVKGPCGSDDSFEEWSNSAHEFLVSAFKDLTTPEMHRRWKLRGNNG